MARTVEQRILDHEPGYRPGYILPAAERLARELGLGVDTVRDAYRLLATMGLVTIRHGYGAEVRTEREREVIIVPADTALMARMPTFAEMDRWQLDPGVPMLVAGEDAWPADRYEVRVASSED